ncbi:hypothetical protein [Rhizobium leguminosarum]|nr:hypothetical protein [Rhizobium leguminosarum]
MLGNGIDRGCLAAVGVIDIAEGQCSVSAACGPPCRRRAFLK